MIQTPLEIIRLDVTDSTQLEVRRRLANRTTPGPLLVLADRQEAGRGRLGRTWFGEPGCTLMFSLWVPTSLSPVRVSLLSLASGVALAEWLKPYIEIGLKWPNDVLGPDLKKIAGILCESLWNDDSTPVGAIVGVGINVSWPVGGPPEDISATAAALSDYADVRIDALRDRLFEWVNLLQTWHKQLQAGELKQLAAAYNGFLRKIGRPVTHKSFETGHSVGYIEGISEMGKLQLRLKNGGELIEVESGELELTDIPMSTENSGQLKGIEQSCC